MGKVKGYATVGPYPTESMALKVSTGLSILAVFLVIVLGWFFAELKSHQEETDLLVKENNGLLKEVAETLQGMTNG